jgi:hypothetical protein
MSTDTNTTLQTGTTPNPFPSNAQDFSGSDDEILDNFADGPIPDGADTHDDGTPMGLGGEKGKQAEPASSTLEADIVNGTTKQPGEEPEDTAGEPQPVQDAGETGPETKPEPPDEPETPEFPPALLQMAGLADADAAQAAGFQTPEALFAAIKWRSQLLTPGTQPAQASEQGLYRRRSDGPTAPTPPAPEPVPEKDVRLPEGEAHSFELPADKMGMLDEDLQEVIRQMNDHYQGRDASQQRELQALRAELDKRDESRELQQAQDEEMRFDEAVQALGEDWRDVFGEGNGRDLDRRGQSDPVAMTNFNHRVLLFKSVQTVREVNAKQGYKPMTLEQEVQWALMQRYPDKFQQTISGNSKPGPRPGVTASRPTQRKTPPKSQNEKILSDVNAMLKKQHGYSLDMGQEEEFDGEI